jgi:beta-galactosidase
VVYTNCDAVELYLNGVSLGEQTYEDEQLLWHVPYRPGELRAVGRREGKNVAQARQITAGDAAAVRVVADRRTVRANQSDVIHLEIDITDKDGILVPHADHEVYLDIDGPARLLGVDNGDPLDLSCYTAKQRKAFHGKCLAIVQATDRAGLIAVTCSATGLNPGVATIKAG